MSSTKDTHQITGQPSTTASHALGQVLKEQWRLAKEHPEMREAFNQSLAQLVPYTGTVFPKVEELASGWCRVSMEDRPEIRNHLNSIHAVALMNLAELASGLIILFTAPENCRSIIVGLNIRYFKKARGKITAECRWDAPEKVEKKEYVLDISLCDQGAEIVARARADWLIGRGPSPHP